MHVSIALDDVQQSPALFPSTYTLCNRVTHRFRFHSLYFVFYSCFDRFIYSLFVSLLYRRVIRVQSSRTSTVALQRRLQCDHIVFDLRILILVSCIYSRVLASYFISIRIVLIVLVASNVSSSSRTSTVAFCHQSHRISCDIDVSTSIIVYCRIPR